MFFFIEAIENKKIEVDGMEIEPNAPENMEEVRIFEK
jgi:hypothetical protein